MTSRQLGIPFLGGQLPGELIVDLFAGGGGASHGIEKAVGRSPDIAINHDAAAIRMHEANHPATRHLCENIYSVSPRAVTDGLPVGLLWASPDCRHFSKAKGKAPVSKAVRGLAWMVLRWAALVRPRMIFLENVEEFTTWGPVRRGRPVKKHAGVTFARWLEQLAELGYVVEHRLLRACDYRTPTTRRRLFLVARCDGQPITWPEPTHGPKRSKPYRAAAECIDWSIPCPSIFLSREGARDWKRQTGQQCKRPLSEKTLRRIAAGVVRYVLDTANPFLVRCAHGSRGGDDSRTRSLDDPLPTITGSRDCAIVAPYLVPRYGEREGQDPRARRIDQPMPTIVPTGNGASLVAAFLAKHNGKTVGQDIATEPLHTVTGRDTKALIAAHLTKFRGTSTAADIAGPAPTITGQGNHLGLVAALLVHYYGSGTQAQGLSEPMHTIVSKARHGLVVVTIAGDEYVLVDIGMRMLEPHELALAQGFPADYILTGTKAQRVKRVGNSVCPPVAEAIITANLPAQRKAVA